MRANWQRINDTVWHALAGVSLADMVMAPAGESVVPVSAITVRPARRASR